MKLPTLKVLTAHGPLDAFDLYVIAGKGALSCLAHALAQEGLDIDASVADRGGLNALLVAAREKRAKHVALLLEKGANVNAVDASGKGALDHAVASKKEEIAALLVEAGANAADDASKRQLTRWGLGTSAEESAEDEQYTTAVVGAWACREVIQAGLKRRVSGELTLEADGTFKKCLQGHPEISGTWTIDGRTVLIARQYCAEPQMAELSDDLKTLWIPDYDEEHGDHYRERYTRPK